MNCLSNRLNPSSPLLRPYRDAWLLVGAAALALVYGCSVERRGAATDSAALVVSADSEAPSVGCDQHPREWTCSVGHGVQIKVRMALDAKDTSANPLIALRIQPLSGKVVAHTLPVGENMGEISGSDVTMSDLDGDGFGDLLLQLPFGHPNNTVQLIWRYQPGEQRFVNDSVLSGETNVAADEKGCVRTSGYLGMSHQTDSKYCLVSGRWIEVARHEQMADTTGAFMEYFYERRGDSLALVKKQPMEP